MNEQHNKVVREIYFDTLLALSQNDEEIASELLNLNGMDPDRLVSRTLKNIARYKATLNMQPDAAGRDELLALIQERIVQLMQTAPEKVKALLEGFFGQRKVVYAFKRAKTPADRVALEAISGQDLLQLLDDLNQLDA